MAKKSVGIIFGGKSTEHLISLRSARYILKYIDKKIYEVVLLYIDKKGRWYLYDTADFLLCLKRSTLRPLHLLGKNVILVPCNNYCNLITYKNLHPILKLDIIFPVIHGSLGEDGSLQGFLRMMNIPFVGSDVLGSAVSMDKDFTKRLLINAGINVAPWFSVTQENIHFIQVKKIINDFGLPLFIKPCSQGSSVGVTKVNSISTFNKALNIALNFDRKILIEKYIKGREIECAVLGNYNPIASPCGEIILYDDFYTYNTKYHRKNSAQIVIPAKIGYKISEAIRSIAVTAFQRLECFGMARIDFFLTNKNEIIVNEVNTIPGFTKISMYPKLWQAAGLNYTKLITRLIELAQERYLLNSKLKISI